MERTTNFFNQLAQLELKGTLQLLIAKGENTNLIVSVLPQNSTCGDDAKHLIIPYTINATPDELDSNFFEKITTPIQKASALMDNMEDYLQRLEEAKKQSAMEKEKIDKEKKEIDAKEKKYKEAMGKADVLEREGKFREAWMAVPEVTHFPDKADEIRKRKSELSNQFPDQGLFAALPIPTSINEPIN